MWVNILHILGILLSIYTMNLFSLFYGIYRKMFLYFELNKLITKYP